MTTLQVGEDHFRFTGKSPRRPGSLPQFTQFVISGAPLSVSICLSVCQGHILPLFHATSPCRSLAGQARLRDTAGHPEGPGGTETPFPAEVPIPVGSTGSARTGSVCLSPGGGTHTVLILNVCPRARGRTSLSRLSGTKLTESSPSWPGLRAQPQEALALLILSSA